LVGCGTGGTLIRLMVQQKQEHMRETTMEIPPDRVPADTPTVHAMSSETVKFIRKLIETPLEADGTQRGKPVRYADAEANVVPPTTPPFRQGPDGVTHFERHEYSLKRRVLNRL
jgi:hypothetical protein